LIVRAEVILEVGKHINKGDSLTIVSIENKTTNQRYVYMKKQLSPESIFE
jgi:hypothetical protein